MKLHFLNQSAEGVRWFGYISVVEASAHEQLRIHNKRAYRVSFRRRGTGTQETVMLRGLQSKGEKNTRSTKVKRSLQSAVR